VNKPVPAVARRHAVAAMFPGYEQECQQLLQAVRVRVDALGDVIGPARRASIERGEADLASVRELVEHMELEAGSAAKADRTGLLARARMHKASAAVMATELKRAVVALPRDELLGCRPEERAEREEQHARLLATNERTRASTQKLREAHRTVIETEEIGASIMGDLASQRQTLMHSMGALKGTGERLERSRRIIAAIGRRAWQNRAIMWVMIGMLVLLVLLLLFTLVHRGGGAASGGPEPPAEQPARGRSLLLRL
jgi:vesicle transport through interaction with t-SNAREs protein 1